VFTVTVQTKQKFNKSCDHMRPHECKRLPICRFLPSCTLHMMQSSSAKKLIIM